MATGKRALARTKAQLRADRMAVREAVAQAVRAMVEEGAMHGCGDHFEFDDECGRCRWVNDKLSAMADP